jgi:hypothetical protein
MFIDTYSMPAAISLASPRSMSKATTAKIVDYLLGHGVLTKIQRERRLSLRA